MRLISAHKTDVRAVKLRVGITAARFSDLCRTRLAADDIVRTEIHIRKAVDQMLLHNVFHQWLHLLADFRRYDVFYQRLRLNLCRLAVVIRNLIHEMRLHKTDDEVELMQKAATISAEAHMLAMKKTRPGMNEFQVESLMESYMRDRGASGVAYNSIIGGGDNATILHYVENNMPLKDGDLVIFALHPTFGDPPARIVTVEDGEAELTLLSYGSFTVGAIADDGTELELDLAELPGVSQTFKDR